ncbi:hypothetical protein, partial [Synechococcus lacustris]|uniref:hypothetical protein n=1 Tax=Synechococcus lacustris TaxID=2116544 RepID=UPI00333EE3C3
DKSGFISLDSNDQIMITKEDWDGMYDKALVRIDEEVSRKAAAGAWNEDQTNAEKERLINNMRSPAEFQDDVREAITQLAISGTMKRKEGISNVDDYNLHGLNEYFASAGDIMSARQRIEQDMRDIGIIFDANINQYTWQSDSRMYQEGHKEKLDGLKKMHSMLVQGQHIEKIVCDQINQGDSLREGFNLLNREVEVDDVVIQKLSESVARLQHLVEQEGASNEQKEQLEIGLKFVNSLALEKAEAENEGGKLHVSRFTLAQVCAGDLGKGRVLNANPNAAMHVDDQLFVPDFKSATDIMQMRNAQKLETLLTSKVATLKQEIERGNYSLGVIAEQEIHAPEQQRKIEETLQLKGQELAIIEKGF